MLDLLQSISEGRHEPDRLDAVMSSEGTELIVGQMNLARRVSMVQYRTLLTGLMEAKKPEIEPVDSTSRSRNGVVGLLENAWPLLNWGLDHTEVMRQRVHHLQVGQRAFLLVICVVDVPNRLRGLQGIGRRLHRRS